MLCTFCSNIDLDQLATKEGYKHHASCADLLKSADDGCASCKLIWDAQWVQIGGDLSTSKHDLGSLETHIIAKAVNQEPGDYQMVRYGQETRFYDYHSKVMFSGEDPSLEYPFVWSFLSIAAKSGMQSVRPSKQILIERR